ncbi:MAG: glycosyltransferase family 4 protein [Gammaproteobacteria bacterium]|nr:glycosyltransferase family 4 protein [Gammaproteobacteria bacterium]MYF29893.1 glycosyltransferase family 4 protein [Gammaproteobacteria bacterium]
MVARARYPGCLGTGTGQARPLRILLLTQNFPPEIGAKAARLHELATRLAARGHDVRVITALPNYPTGMVFEGFRGRLRVEEQLEGVRVIRTWLKPSNSAQPFPRLVSYLTFVASSLLLGVRGTGRRDIVFIESPPLFLVLAGLLMGRMAKACIVMNVSDIWPETAVRAGLEMRGVPLRLLERLERLGYEKSDLVTATTQKASDSIASRFPKVATAVIPGGTDLELFRPERRSEDLRRSLGIGEADHLVGYCGLHGLFQGLETVIGAAEKLRNDPRIKFVLAGDGPTKRTLVEVATAARLDNVVFMDPMPREQVGELVASFDVALAPLAAELPGTMPSKVYETLACGVPLVVTEGSEAARLVTDHALGRVVGPLDVDALAGAIADLLDEPAEVNRIRRDARRMAQRYDLDEVARGAEATFLELVGDTVGAPRTY